MAPQIPDDRLSYVQRSLTVNMVTPGGKLASPSDPLEFDFVLEPLKPFEASVQLVLNKSTGGRWRYLMRVVASEPEPDDVIDIEATLHRTSSVSFGITNHFPQYAPFKVRLGVPLPAFVCVCSYSRVPPLSLRRRFPWRHRQSSLCTPQRASCRLTAPRPLCL